MQNALAGLGSKKLMLVAALCALIVKDAESRPAGWMWWHAISLAVLGLGYCIAQAFDDGMRGHGSEAQEFRTPDETKPPA